MNHAHLPALNRYTSSAQYFALQEIQKHKSLTPLLMKGRLSNTIGALIRSAWVKSADYTDTNGVMREGWCVTDAGLHAMKLYEAKLEEQRKIEEERERIAAEAKERQQKFYDAAVTYYKSLLETQHLEKCANMYMAGVYRPRAEQLAQQAQQQALNEWNGTTPK